MEDVAHLIFRGVHAVDHAHQQSLPRWDGDVAPGRSVRCGARSGRSQSRRGRSRMTRERQRHNVICVERLNFPAHLEAKHRLGASEVLSFQNAAIFQFQGVRSGHAHKKQSERHRGQETIYFPHSSLSRSEITNSSDLFTFLPARGYFAILPHWMMGMQ